jgi:hypothetical protein
MINFKTSAQTLARERLKVIFDRHSHLFGRDVLEVGEFVSRYPQFCLPCAAAFEAHVPDALPIDGHAAPELEDGFRRYNATYLYRFTQGAFNRLEVLASGGLLIDKKIIPNTGLGKQRGSLLSSIAPKLRKSRRESCVVAPWPHSHYSNLQLTYGDFMLHLLPRICRTCSRMTDGEKKKAVMTYPLANTTWERAYLSKLGFEPEQLVDSRLYKIELPTDGVIYAPSGEDSDWSRRSAHPADYEEARRAFLKSPPTRTPSRRLYLQRQGRRRILNEQKLLPVLQSHGFETIRMGEHSISDQIAMIADASIILGAHGADLINMIWSPPGASVVEFYNRGFRPSFNRQMAYNLSLNYYYWAQPPMERHNFAHLNWDIEVDADAVDRFLTKTFI